MWRKIDPETLGYITDFALYHLRRQWTDDEEQVVPFDEDVELEPIEDDDVDFT